MVTLPGLCRVSKSISYFIIHNLIRIRHEKKQELTPEEQTIIGLFARIKEMNRKQEEVETPTKYMNQTIRLLQKRLFKSLLKAGVVPDERIEVRDSERLVELFSQIRQLPEFAEDKKKAAMLTHAMDAIFKFPISWATVLKFYYRSKEV